jgi:hypothetical protein
MLLNLAKHCVKYAMGGAFGSSWHNCCEDQSDKIDCLVRLALARRGVRVIATVFDKITQKLYLTFVVEASTSRFIFINNGGS